VSIIGASGCGFEPDKRVESTVAALDRDAIAEGQELFEAAPEVSNGTACVHCHVPSTGTLNPEQAGELALDHPLFQHDRRDFKPDTFEPIDSFERFLAHATITVGIGLRDNVVVDDTPSVGMVFFARGIPSTINIGFADDVVMLDGRLDSLEEQAVAATEGHAEATLTEDEGEARGTKIPIFEQDSRERGYSSHRLFLFAHGGRAPKLPNGPGRRFFEPGGACARCHGGPALNTTVDGDRFASNGSSDANALGNRVMTFTFTNQDDSTTDVVSPDPGRALITGDAADANKFKIPSLWNVVNTAPYFHDNSTNDLEDAVSHYAEAGIVELTDDDIEDIVHFLKKL